MNPWHTSKLCKFMLLYQTRMLRWVHQQDVRDSLCDINRHSRTSNWPDYLHIPHVQTNQHTLCDTWPCNVSLKSWLERSSSLLVIAGSLTHTWGMCSDIWVQDWCSGWENKLFMVFILFSSFLPIRDCLMSIVQFSSCLNVTEVKASSSCVFLQAQQACLKNSAALWVCLWPSISCHVKSWTKGYLDFSMGWMKTTPITFVLLILTWTSMQTHWFKALTRQNKCLCTRHGQVYMLLLRMFERWHYLKPLLHALPCVK